LILPKLEAEPRVFIGKIHLHLVTLAECKGMREEVTRVWCNHSVQYGDAYDSLTVTLYTYSAAAVRWLRAGKPQQSADLLKKTVRTPGQAQKRRCPGKPRLVIILRSRGSGPRYYHRLWHLPTDVADIRKTSATRVRKSLALKTLFSAAD